MRIVMSAKYFIYILVGILVIWSFDSLNINSLFKKNRVLQARVLYFMLALSMTYLVTNFIWDFFTVSKILSLMNKSADGSIQISPHLFH